MELTAQGCDSQTLRSKSIHGAFVESADSSALPSKALIWDVLGKSRHLYFCTFPR